MAIAKISLLFFMFLHINAEMFPSYSQLQFDDERPPHKIILRSKRQQCVCVSVSFPHTVDEFDPAMSSFQCSCDPSPGTSTGTAPGSSYVQTPHQREYQQQQELQRELQQIQSPKSQSTSCGCQLSPQYTSTPTPTTAWSAVSFGTTQNPFGFPTTTSSYGYGSEQGNNNNIQPMFDCQCITVPQNNNNNIVNNQPIQQNMPSNNIQQPSYNQPMQYPPQQYLPFTLPPATTTTPQPPTTTTTPPSPNSQIQNRPHCKCVEIHILLSDPQIQCDCSGAGNGNEQETRLPSYPPYTPPTTQSYFQTTTPSPVPTTRPPTFTTPSGTLRTTTQPDALPCVMIQIRTGQKVCACQENFKQCTENVCCNVGKYRSLRTNDDPHPSAGAATVDLLVDLLQKVRESFA